MTMQVVLISSAEALLHMLRQSPATRIALAEAMRDRLGRPVRAVVQRYDRPLPVIKTLAYVCVGSEADELITAAIRAEIAPEREVEWARLPIRFHDFYGACLLPEHPDAPRQHGGWSALWTVPREGLCAEDLPEADMIKLGRELREEWERSVDRRIAFGLDVPDEGSRWR